MKNEKTSIKIIRLLVIAFLVLIGAAVFLNATSAPLIALPKPYQDKIDEAKKKKKEEKDKEKEKEKEKKKEEEEKEQKGDSDKPTNDEADKRYLIPIIPQSDLDPEIRISNVSFLRSGRSNDSFEKGDYVDVRVEFRISSYEGLDNITITCNARDDRNHQIGHDSRSIPIKIDRNITEEFHGIIDTRSIDYAGKFYADVEVKVGNARIGRTIQGRISDGRRHDRGGIRIIDAYLASDDSYLFSYHGYPANSFSEGDPYWIVVEYEIDKASDGDVKFEYELTTGYSLYVDSGQFWDRARDGVQRTYRREWFPYFIPGGNSWVTFHLKASYAGDTDSVSSHYNVYEKSIGYSNDNYMNDFLPGRKSPILKAGPMYFSSYALETNYSSYFNPDESVYMIFKYEYNRLGNDYFETGILQYVINDSAGNEIASRDIAFTPQNKGSKTVKLAGPGEFGVGRYQVKATIKIAELRQTYQGYFNVRNETGLDNIDEELPGGIVAEGNPIEYQVDDYFVISLPPEWNGRLSISEKMPPLVFKPSDKVLGMVMFYDHANQSMTLDEAILEYEKIERKATGIDEGIQSQEISIEDEITRVKFYRGKILTKGQYLEEKTEDVSIGVIYRIYKHDDSSRLYVVRLVGPESESEQIRKTIESLIGRISIGIQEKIGAGVQVPLTINQ